MGLIGHTDAYKIARHFVKHSRRVFGIASPKGVGRQVFVREVFSHVNPKHARDDLKEINAGTLTVAQVRDLDAWISTAPLEATFKFLVLAPATTFTSEAQHALLKLVEDPPEHLIVFLLSEALTTLLPAIQSRLTPLRLYHIARTDAEKIWLSMGVEPSLYNQLWSLAPGQPGLAILRLSKKYPAVLQSVNNFIKNDPTDIGLLHLQATFPQDWTLEDHHDFWLWVAPKLLAVSRTNPLLANFAMHISDFIQQNPSVDTQLGIPAVWHEVARS